MISNGKSALYNIKQGKFTEYFEVVFVILVTVYNNAENEAESGPEQSINLKVCIL